MAKSVIIYVELARVRLGRLTLHCRTRTTSARGKVGKYSIKLWNLRLKAETQ